MLVVRVVVLASRRAHTDTDTNTNTDTDTDTDTDTNTDTHKCACCDSQGQWVMGRVETPNPSCQTFLFHTTKAANVSLMPPTRSIGVVNVSQLQLRVRERDDWSCLHEQRLYFIETQNDKDLLEAQNKTDAVDDDGRKTLTTMVGHKWQR